MKIEKISVIGDGFVSCRSGFYRSENILSEHTRYNFTKGVNRLEGDIDDENWSVSYLLSMHSIRPKDFILFGDVKVEINGEASTLAEIEKYTCYMDSLYPDFGKRKTVRQLVTVGLKNNKMTETADNLSEMFCMSMDRFDRPVRAVGNERSKAMAAIGYSRGKLVYCFPWLSKSRFDYFHGNMTGLLEILERLGVVVILPVGK